MEQRFVSIAQNTSRPCLLDAMGRRLFLRGVNVNALIEYASDYQESVPLAEADFMEMRALGFNLIRLPISWSRLMPDPGAIDGHYLARVEHVLSLAASYGLYVIIDFHQDNYARNLAPTRESDGAPLWAVQTNGRWNWKMSGNPAVEAAWSHFWKNRVVAGKGLQDHYLDALTAVAQRFSFSPAVLAYDLMNEPDPGWALPGYFEARYLFPFYARAIGRVREVDTNHLIMFEPSVIRDATNVAIQCSRPFSDDTKLVYGPHCYTEVASPPFHPVGSRRNPCLYACYWTAAKEAQGFGTPWLFGEFGVDPTPAGDGWIRDQMRFQHQFGVGGAFWVWKQRPGFYHWGVVHPDGSLRRSSRRAEILSQPRVLALSGRVDGVSYDERRRTLSVSGRMAPSASASGLLYASGFAYTKRPEIAIAQADTWRPVRPSEIESLRYDTRPKAVTGWRMALNLSGIEGTYRLIMHPA